MVHPLIQNSNRPRELCHAADGILRQHHHSLLVDHPVDSVVYLRIQVVWTSRQNNAVKVMLLHIFQSIPALLLNGLLKLPVSDASRQHGLTDLILGEVQREQLVHPMIYQVVCLNDVLYAFRIDSALSGEKFRHLSNEALITIVWNERMVEFHVVFAEIFCHVLIDDFRIGSDNRAVVMIRCSYILFVLVVNAWIENSFNIVLHQPFDVAVNQLGRITCSIGGYGIHPVFIHLLIARRAQHNPESQLREKCVPERVILVHVQYPWNTDDAMRCLIRFQNRTIKQQMKFGLVQVRKVVLRGAHAGTLFAAVTRHIAASVGELGYGKNAIVSASMTPSVAGGYREGIDLIQCKNSGFLPLHVLITADDSSAVGPHQS